MKPPRPPAAARALLEPLSRKADDLGLPLYAVGGCVRDWMVGRPSLDLDLVCEGDPRPLAFDAALKLGGAAEEFGRFGTLRIKSPSKLRVDFATSRRETYAEPAALPVVAPAPIEKDLERRDFTVNAMALGLAGPRCGELFDPFEGARDLERRRLRLLHARSLRDDPTRGFRAARYASRLSLKPDADLEAQVIGAVFDGYAARLSAHRLTQELLRLLAEPELAKALALLKKWGYLSLLHERLKAPPAALRGVEERLGAMTLALGKDGPGFLNSLELDRRLSGDLHELLKLAEERRCAKDEIPAAARSVLRAVMPGLAPQALEPLFLRGEDLRALGMPPGPKYKELLDEAAALQWKGTLKGRQAALRWLKGRRSLP